jgi:hypothetical protein
VDASVEVIGADWRNCDTRGGVSDRSTRGKIHSTAMPLAVDQHDLAGFACPLAKTLNELLNGWRFIEQLRCVGRRDARACRRNNSSTRRP